VVGVTAGGGSAGSECERRKRWGRCGGGRRVSLLRLVVKETGTSVNQARGLAGGESLASCSGIGNNLPGSTHFRVLCSRSAPARGAASGLRVDTRQPARPPRRAGSQRPTDRVTAKHLQPAPPLLARSVYALLPFFAVTHAARGCCRGRDLLRGTTPPPAAAHEARANSRLRRRRRP
jgi:hypothetical protein